MLHNLQRRYGKYSDALCARTKFRRFEDTNAYTANDMLYAFHLKKLSNQDYTLEFGVRPLCQILRSVDACDFELGDLTEGLYFGTTDIDVLWKNVTDRIIPFFDACESPEAAAREIRHLYEQMDELRLERLNKNGITDCAKPIIERISFNDSVFYLAMKSLDYDSMLLSLSYKIPVSEGKIAIFNEEFEKCTAEGQKKMAAVYEEKRQNESKYCAYLQKLLNRANARDDDFFRAEIQARESCSRERLPAELFV